MKKHAKPSLNDRLLAELEGIAKLEGDRESPTADGVVLWARERPLEFPLCHARIPWDDAKAAHERRLDVARGLIRWVTRVVTDHSRIIILPYYSVDPSKEPGEQGYTTLPRLMNDDDLARHKITQECLSLLSQLQRLRDLATVLNMEDEVNELLRPALILQERLDRTDLPKRKPSDDAGDAARLS